MFVKCFPLIVFYSTLGIEKGHMRPNLVNRVVAVSLRWHFWTQINEQAMMYELVRYHGAISNDLDVFYELLHVAEATS